MKSKNWLVLASTTCLLGGSIVLGATTDIGIIQMLAMSILAAGGILFGVQLSND